MNKPWGVITARALVWVAAAAMTVFAGGARAQANSIESVTSQQQGASTQLRVVLKAPPAAAPNSFSVNTPPRVALDFSDTANKVGQGAVEFAQGDVRSVAIVQAGNRSRVVMNLKRPMSYTTRVDGNVVLVTLTAAADAAGAASAAGAAPFTPAKADDRVSHALRDLDFRRGKDGEGRVVVELSDGGIGVDIRQQGPQLIVDFLRAKLPDSLRKRLDVTDFGTPIKSVRAFQQGENARLVIEPQGTWEHNAYQSDTQFVVEVKPVREDPNKLGSQRGYTGDRLSLNFQNVEVRTLLQVIADFKDINIIARESVTGTLTLRLMEVPWDQALDIVMQAKDLAMRKNGNVILVAPRKELHEQEKADLEERQQISDIEPTRSEVFQLNYQKADDVAKMLLGDKLKVLSKNGSAVPDIRTNKLFIKDTASHLEDVRKLIAQIDIPVRQVLIEARIVQADDLFSRNLGAKLGFNDNRSTVTRTVAVPDPVTGQLVSQVVPVYGAGSSIGGGYATISGNLQGAADLSSQLGAGLSSAAGLGAAQGIGIQTALANTNFVNLPAPSIGGFQPGSFAVSLFGSGLSRFLNLELSALEADQRGKVVSSPRVLTADQGKAIIEQGTELPFQVASSSGATAIQFRKATLKLEVVPQITPEGHVIMDVKVNRDAVGQSTPAGFAIDTRAITTKVLVENGGTVVIGGIYEQTERNQENKVPFFGDIPVVGNLFKNTLRTNNRTELLVFLTPRVVTDASVTR